MNDRELPAPAPASGPSRTRDHLANERTFLAWLRTALALIGLGFVLARMGLFLARLAMLGEVGESGPGRGARAGHEFVVTGLVFLILGTGLAGWAGQLYQKGRRSIDSGSYEPAAGSVRALTAIVVVGGVLILGLVLWRL